MARLRCGGNIHRKYDPSICPKEGQVVAWMGPSFLLPASLFSVLSVTVFRKMKVVESTEHLNADIPTPFLLSELLNQSFNFSKSLGIYFRALMRVGRDN